MGNQVTHKYQERGGLSVLSLINHIEGRCRGLIAILSRYSNLCRCFPFSAAIIVPWSVN